MNSEKGFKNKVIAHGALHKIDQISGQQQKKTFKTVMTI